MSEQSRSFAIGDRVRVSDQCFNTMLHGAVGTVQPNVVDSINRDDPAVVWVEFDPMIATGGSPIDAAEVDAADLDFA